MPPAASVCADDCDVVCVDGAAIVAEAYRLVGGHAFWRRGPLPRYQPSQPEAWHVLAALDRPLA
eukprot:5314802-Pyramimonas_sp.AAC.1